MYHFWGGGDSNFDAWHGSLHENQTEAIESPVKDSIQDESSSNNGNSLLKSKNTFTARFMHKKWSFPWRISSVNVSKSAGNCWFGQKFLMEIFTFYTVVLEVCLTIFGTLCIKGLRDKNSEIPSF